VLENIAVVLEIGFPVLGFALEQSRDVGLAQKLHTPRLAPVGYTAINVEWHQVMDHQTSVISLLLPEHDLELLAYFSKHVLTEKAKLIVNMNCQTRTFPIGIFDCFGNKKKRRLCRSKLVSGGKDGDLSKVYKIVVVPASGTTFAVDQGRRTEGREDMFDLLTHCPNLEVRRAEQKLSCGEVLRQVMIFQGFLQGKREELHKEPSK